MVSATLEDLTAPASSASGGIETGTQIGRYTTIECVGTGSMGIPDDQAQTLRREYADAVDGALPHTAHALAERLATHWRDRECSALAREWAALAARQPAGR